MTAACRASAGPQPSTQLTASPPRHGHPACTSADPPAVSGPQRTWCWRQPPAPPGPACPAPAWPVARDSRLVSCTLRSSSARARRRALSVMSGDFFRLAARPCSQRCHAPHRWSPEQAVQLCTVTRMPMYRPHPDMPAQPNPVMCLPLHRHWVEQHCSRGPLF